MSKRFAWFILFFYAAIFLACKSTLVTKTVGNSEIGGIWVLEDGKKMAEYLGISTEGKRHYCIELEPEKSEAKVRFIFSREVYPLTFQRENDVFVLLRNGKSRSFSIHKDGDHYYWNFIDSTPYNPKEDWQRDGGKENCRNVDECIERLEVEYKQAMENEKEGPMGNFSPPVESGPK